MIHVGDVVVHFWHGHKLHFHARHRATDVAERRAVVGAGQRCGSTALRLAVALQDGHTVQQAPRTGSRRPCDHITHVHRAVDAHVQAHLDCAPHDDAQELQDVIGNRSRPG